jgi:hypothetical protein
MAPWAKRPKPDFRYFILLHPDTKKEVRLSSGSPYVKRARQPRDAALKFARDGFKKILIRETGKEQKTVHAYRGRKMKVKGIMTPRVKKESTFQLKKKAGEALVMEKWAPNKKNRDKIPKVTDKHYAKTKPYHVKPNSGAKPSTKPSRQAPARKLILSAQDLTESAMDKKKRGDTSGRAIHDTLAPILSPFMNKKKLEDLMDVVLGLRLSYNEIKTRFDMEKYMIEIVRNVARDYKNDTTVQVTVRSGLAQTLPEKKTMILSLQDLTKGAWDMMKMGVPTEQAIYDTLRPVLTGFMNNAKLEKFVGFALDDNTESLEMHEIKTRSEVKDFMADLIRVLQQEYEDSTSVLVEVK